MNPLAILVIVLVLIGVLVNLLYMSKVDEVAVETERNRDNLRRMNLSRTVNDDFYTHEDDDGSLQWRRISAG